MANRQVLSLDLGGALAYRANGDPKGSAFSVEVGEIHSLRDKQLNPAAERLFGDMTRAQLIEAIRLVTDLADSEIFALLQQHQASHKLIDKLLSRKADMLQQLHHL